MYSPPCICGKSVTTLIFVHTQPYSNPTFHLASNFTGIEKRFSLTDDCSTEDRVDTFPDRILSHSFHPISLYSWHLVATFSPGYRPSIRENLTSSYQTQKAHFLPFSTDHRETLWFLQPVGTLSLSMPVKKFWSSA